MGSFAHAQTLHASGRETTGMIALEMLGRFDDAEGSQQYPLDAMGCLYPTTGNFIGVVGRLQDIPLTRAIKAAMRAATDVPVHSINALPFVVGIDFSDHRNYWHFDYHAVMITDTAFYRNTDYHTADDIADKLDYTRMAKVLRGVYAAALAITSSEAGTIAERHEGIP